MNYWAQHSPNLFLSKFSAKDIIKSKNEAISPPELIYLQESDTLSKVLDIFHLNKILSAPVIAKGTEKILGMLDIVINSF